MAPREAKHEETGWVMRHLGALLAIVINVASIGAIYATMRAEIAHNTERITQLESQKADETKVLVAMHEKRLDQHDQILRGMSDQLSKMVGMLERIDQHTAAK